MIALTRRPLLTVLALIAGLVAIVLTIGPQDARSASYTSCSLTESDQDPPGSRPTYNLSVKAQRTSCTTAKKVVHAFHKCRSISGYQCTRKVLAHWACSGKKDSSTELIFYGSFTCKWGVRRVKSSYQQNT